MYFLYATMALLAGIGLASQAAINSHLGKSLLNQPIYAALVSFAVGTMALFFLALSRGSLGQAMSQIPNQPWWSLSGGLIGSFLVFSSILLAPKLGMANMLLLIILGQLFMGLMIDHFGLIYMPVNPVTVSKIIGIAVVIMGIVIFFFGERWLKSL